MSRDGWAALSRGATGLSAVCDCGISWSYPLTIFEMVQRRAARWTLSEYSPYASVTQMLQSLGWRSLEQRRSDSRLCLFYKIIYGLVAIDMPPSVVHPLRTPRNSHTLCFRQIQSTVDYYKYSFYPLSIVQWNRLPAHIALLPTFDSFKRAVCTVSHPMP